MNSWPAILVGTVFIIVCVLLMIIILLQRGRGGGLAGAFGGAGGHSAFGAKTGDVFTWVTVALTGIFLILAVVSNYVLVPERFSAPTAPQPPVKAEQNVPPKATTPAPAAKTPAPAARTTTQPVKP